MKKIAAAATLAAVLTVTAVAYAVNNVVTYVSKVSYSGKADGKAAKNVGYTGTLTVRGEGNAQPNIAPSAKVFFDKNLQTNAKLFPSCTAAEIDGKRPLPAKCNAAVIGKGTAIAYAGTPGTPITASAQEKLDVTAVNGPNGKQVLLVLNGTTPIDVPNRIVPGTFGKGSGKYGVTVNFVVPRDLQERVGLQIALADFSVSIAKTPTISTKVKGKQTKVSYLQIKKCPAGKKLFAKAVTTFLADDGVSPGATASSPETSTACK